MMNLYVSPDYFFVSTQPQFYPLIDQARKHTFSGLGDPSYRKGQHAHQHTYRRRPTQYSVVELLQRRPNLWCPGHHELC